MPDQKESFLELISRLRSGDESAAVELLHSCEAHVRRVIRVRLTEPGLRRQFDSVDICQSVMADFFVRIALGQFELETHDQLAGLLATMARNKLFHHLRKQTAQRRDIRRLTPGPVDELPLSAKQETPSQIVAARELLAIVRARMSDEDRYLADQRATGRPWSELAEELDAGADALRVRLARAIDRVAKSLALEEPHDDGS